MANVEMSETTAEREIKETADAIRAEGPIMGVDTSDVLPEELQRIESEMNSLTAYMMKKERRGRAIIIGNTEFDDSNFRSLPGVEHDMENLVNIFTELKFDCRLWKNQSLEELETRLMAESRREDHQDADAFVMCIASHGNINGVYTKDGKLLYFEKLMRFFDGNGCQNLIDKPKLFIIDTCQGGKETKGVTARCDARSTAEVLVPDKIHEKNDMFRFCSTTPEYKAFGVQHGSIFIQTLVYVLTRRAHNTRWIDMAIEVTRLMTYFREQGVWLQSPFISGHVPKHLYLLPRQKLRIRATYGSDRYELTVHPSKTIGTLRKELTLRLKLPANTFLLMYTSGGRILNDDQRALSDCRIPGGEVLLDTRPSSQ